MTRTGAAAGATPAGVATGARDGALVIDKPAGLTSHDVVAAIRRATGSKVGHTGTLDPLATGVLPLLVGRATRLARFAASDAKAYLARIRFGWSTDTYDAAGRPVGPPLPRVIDRSAIEAVLPRFRGRFTQQPPAYSAKKIGGARAYALARADARPQLAPVTVTVHSLELVEVAGDTVVLRITCAAGFYVRSLAHDLGVALECGAHLAALRRLASGPFGEPEAIALEALLAQPERIDEVMLPLERLLTHIPAVAVTPAGLDRLRHGQALGPSDLAGAAPAAPGEVRLLAPDGRLAAVAVSATATVLRPVVVLM